MNGGSGNDTLEGGDGDDLIDAETLSKYSSNNGRNILIGGLGNDTLRGGFAEGGLQNGSSTLDHIYGGPKNNKGVDADGKDEFWLSSTEEERMYFMILMSIRID